MFLDRETFQHIVAHTPLISMDLVVENAQGEFLLGLRRNRPAKDCWFVPGGRVQKGETLDDAFLRITREELGRGVARVDVEPLGVYEHFYNDSVFGGATSTHYVVLAYHFHLAVPLNEIPKAQHNAFRWWKQEDAITDSNVHRHTKQYFDYLGVRRLREQG